MHRRGIKETAVENGALGSTGERARSRRVSSAGRQVLAMAAEIQRRNVRVKDGYRPLVK